MDVAFIFDLNQLNHEKVDLVGDNESLDSYTNRRLKECLTFSEFYSLMNNAASPTKVNQFHSLDVGLRTVLLDNTLSQFEKQSTLVQLLNTTEDLTNEIKGKL